MKSNNFFSPNPFLPLPCKFNSLLYNNLYSDFTLIIMNPPEGKSCRIPVHRFLLDAFSIFFHSFFESYPNEHEINVCFPNWATLGVYSVLEFIYTSENIQFTDSNICPIYIVAHSWSISTLENQCLNFLETSATPQASLSILFLISEQLPHDSAARDNLIKLVVSNFSNFKPSEFETLKFPLFNTIIEEVFMTHPEDIQADHLCNAISHYIQANILTIDPNEFDQLLNKFTMKTSNDGIFDLYQISLRYGWSLETCENKILHSWCRLNPDRLIEIPPSRLIHLLHENLLNIDSEDSMLDFIIRIRQKDHSMESLELWKAIRVSALTDAGRSKLQSIPEAFNLLKDQFSSSKFGKWRNNRLPREKIKLLILGAADDDALNDVKDMLLTTYPNAENLTIKRADDNSNDWNTFNFDQYHVVLVFGFYQFANADVLSERLYDFYSRGGGLVVAYGALGPDDLGDPLYSILPINTHKNMCSKEQPVNELIKLGCPNMRIICQESEAGVAEVFWEDKIPFLISRKQTGVNGAMYVLNASPVSSQIILNQWDKQEKTIPRIIANATTNAANCVHHYH